MMKPAKERFCYNCGAPLGRYTDYDNLDTCGERECTRAAQDAESMRRDEAHEQLDRDNGWDRW